jgi:poly(A) polymerase
MRLAFEIGLVTAILPPLAALEGLFAGDPAHAEDDLWDETMRVLERLPKNPSFPLAFAGLVHNVGKPSSMELCEDRCAFTNHEVAGARIAEGLCRALKLSNAEREQITWLVAQQQSLVAADKLRPSKLKRILAEPGIDELLELHRAIALASSGNSDHVEYCRRYLEVQPAGPINPSPLVTGDDLVRHGLEPGPSFATLLNQLRDAQLEGQIRSREEALEWVDRQRAGGS